MNDFYIGNYKIHIIMLNILNLFEKSTFLCFSRKAWRSEMTLYIYTCYDLLADKHKCKKTK